MFVNGSTFSERSPFPGYDWAGRAREERSKINFLNLYRQPDITLTKSINTGRACDGLLGLGGGWGLREIGSGVFPPPRKPPSGIGAPFS